MTKNENTPSGVIAGLEALIASIGPVVASGEEASVSILRARILKGRELIFEATNTFDSCLRNAQSGMDGSDMLASVETFRKLSDKVGRPKKVKPALPEEVTNW